MKKPQQVVVRPVLSAPGASGDNKEIVNGRSGALAPSCMFNQIQFKIRVTERRSRIDENHSKSSKRRFQIARNEHHHCRVLHGAFLAQRHHQFTSWIERFRRGSLFISKLIAFYLNVAVRDWNDSKRRCQTIQVISLIRGINFDSFNFAVALVTCSDSAFWKQGGDPSIRPAISFFLLSRLLVQFYGQSNRLLLPKQALQKRVRKSSSLLQIMSIQKILFI